MLVPDDPIIRELTAVFDLRSEDLSLCQDYDLNIIGVRVRPSPTRYTPRPGARPLSVVIAVFLTWIIEQARTRAGLFTAVDNLYASLDYPNELANIASYMSPVDETPSPEKLESAILAFRNRLLDDSFSTAANERAGSGHADRGKAGSRA